MTGARFLLPESTVSSLTMAGSWVFVTIVLYQYVDAATFSICLFSLFFSELLSDFLLAGVHRQKFGFTNVLSWEDTVGHIMMRWILLTSLLVLVSYADLLTFYCNHHFTILCVMGLCLTLALIKSAATRQRNVRKWVLLIMQARLLVIACAIAVATKFGPVDSDLVMTLTVAILLCLLIVSFWRLSPSAKIESKPIQGSVLLGRSAVAGVPLLFKNADLLILPWIFPPAQALFYLLVRGIAGAIGLILGSLTSILRDPLYSAFEQENRSAFVAMAARANLGFLLIGGGACLVVLSAGPYLLDFVSINSSEMKKVLAWVVVAQAAPVFFGATSILLDVTRNQRDSVLIAGIGALAVWISTAVIDIISILDLAMVYAGVRVVASGAAATILGLRFGIWPGLTAILFRQIKLF
ncbi:MAG: hypothetical protein WA790_17285 [Sulfitobacter sp.]